MNDIHPKDNDIPGLQQAIACYGPPVERSFTLQVGEKIFRYWQATRQKRLAEVVLLLQRKNGRYLAHTKDFYPPATYRLISGGIKPGEDLLAAVRREAYEETGLLVRIERFLALLRYRFYWQGYVLPFASYVFGVVEEDGTLKVNDPGEAISGFREVTLAELDALAAQLEALHPEWEDWGRFRAIAHRVILEILAAQHDLS